MQYIFIIVFFFFQAEDGIRDHCVTGVQTCALPISHLYVQKLEEQGTSMNVPRPCRHHINSPTHVDSMTSGKIPKYPVMHLLDPTKLSQTPDHQIMSGSSHQNGPESMSLIELKPVSM